MLGICFSLNSLLKSLQRTIVLTRACISHAQAGLYAVGFGFGRQLAVLFNIGNGFGKIAFGKIYL
ncbi:MAG TPA: hypothetical protein DCF33_01295 [Saprospirales bacterium]|nr:hypothetical protein [Saprospirales bacterium]